MSIITVEIARFGHAKKRTKVKVRRGMAWKDFLDMASAKVGMATSDGVEVTNSKGCCIRGTADLSDKCIVILREGRARTAVEPLYQMVTAQSEKLRRHAPMRAHSFSGHDVSPYATVGAISPIIQHHPFRHPSQVRGRLQSLPAPLSPPSPSRMYSGPPLSPAIRRPAFAPHVSPAPTRVHPMSPPQSPALQRGPSPPRMEASIINPFICSLVLLEKVQQDGDSIVAVAESKEEENVQQTRKLFRVKVAFVRTDIKGFRHPFENEVLILQRLRGQSSHLSSNHVVPSTCLAYCKTREDLSLLHRTMHHEITHAFELLMNFTPGKVFVCVYPLALDTLWEKALTATPADVLKYSTDMLKCLLFLQQFGVIHRSLALNKFQVFPGPCVKLTDFEDAIAINSHTLLFHYRNVGPFGTNLSMMNTLAPEVLNAHARHEAAPQCPDDTVDYSMQYSWAFGMLFNLLASGNPSLPDYPGSYGLPGQVDYMPEQVKVSIPEQYPPGVREAVTRCLSANPNHRTSLRQLLAVFGGQEVEAPVQHHQLSARSQVSLTSAVTEEEQALLRSGERAPMADMQLYARAKKKQRRGQRSQTQPVNIGVDQIMQAKLEDGFVQPATVRDTARIERHKQPIVPPPSGFGASRLQLSLHSLVEPNIPRLPRARTAAKEMREHERRMAKSVYDVRLENFDAWATSSTSADVQSVSSSNILMPSSMHSASESSTATAVTDVNAQQVRKDLVASGQVSSMSAHPPDIQTEAFPHEAQVVSIEIPDTNGQSDKMAAESITPHDFQQELPVPDRLIPREEGPPSYLEACASIGVGINAKPQPQQMLVHMPPHSQQIARKQKTIDLSRHHSFESSDRGLARNSYSDSQIAGSSGLDQTLSVTSEKNPASLNLQRSVMQGAKSTAAGDTLAKSAPTPPCRPATEGLTAAAPSSCHKVIPTGGHSSGSGNSCDDGAAVTIEYFPSCYTPEEDVVFPEGSAKPGSGLSSDVHNRGSSVDQLQGREKTDMLSPNYQAAADIQRSQSLNRGHQGIVLNADWSKPAAVSARGPQTRSVYDLRGEDSPFIFSVLSEADLQKPCGHKCMMQDKHFCCLCKKNSSWTFCDSGSSANGPVAMWSKGCHMCRRRATELNQLSTVSRPRAVRTSNGSMDNPILSANKDSVVSTATPTVHPPSAKPQSSQSPTTTKAATNRKCAIM